MHTGSYLTLFITVRSFPYVSCDRSVCFLHWKKLKPLNTVKKMKVSKIKSFQKEFGNILYQYETPRPIKEQNVSKNGK